MHCEAFSFIQSSVVEMIQYELFERLKNNQVTGKAKSAGKACTPDPIICYGFSSNVYFLPLFCSFSQWVNGSK